MWDKRWWTISRSPWEVSLPVALLKRETIRTQSIIFCLSSMPEAAISFTFSTKARPPCAKLSLRSIRVWVREATIGGALAIGRPGRSTGALLRWAVAHMMTRGAWWMGVAGVMVVALGGRWIEGSMG
jgi:hypothetical protein